MSPRLAACFVAIAMTTAMTCAIDSHAAEKDSDGYLPLFNGKDLTGWETTGTWVVEEDGVLALKPKPGKRGIFSYRLFLWTKWTFSDFELDFEFKLAKGGDSSVFLRSQSLGGFIEVELTDSHGKEGPLTTDDCGAVQKVTPPSKNMAKPAGEWNRITIKCKGELLQVELNGEQVIDLDYDKLGISVPTSGKIGLQDWGHPVWFRNIRIKKL
ncbi:3-keto-disaccharide hydrolase [Aporhodopirellula aestuarii]|uniref:DUF1080 domain-containing protein n=1 Tax=Aporhodopirellula aestuarii TaxID=2950107 RepID=A0ABT0UBH4_9BACT|nr:DUF1080 domain-containing protein [Aporhodopirellula aestuarii]MCM2374374.1 DUF1080 domain-containing protein [Aporhodopirellula aestuarii]